MEQKRKRFKSIKVPESTYKDIKKMSEDMGKGIGDALDTLVKAKTKAVEDKIMEISDVSEELAEIIMEAGLFDIKLEGVGIENIEEHDESLHIRVLIKVGVPDDDARQQIVDRLNPRTDEEEEEEEDE